MKIVIIDYGIGNLASILNMLNKSRVEGVISSSLEDIIRADKLILPGVGSFDAGMKNLTERGIVEIIKKRVLKDKIPILGICLGMQLFTQKSQEGAAPGLGWIDAEVVKFRIESGNNNLKIPHMGWNHIKIESPSPLFEGLDEQAKFYFVHSYYVVCHKKANVMATTSYGIDFVSSLQQENIYGVQFHPEKSLKYGMRLLNNFARSI